MPRLKYNLRSKQDLDNAKLAAALVGGGFHDVIVWELGTRKVHAILGTRLPLEGGTINAQRRLETAYERIDLNHFTADIVPHGMYEAGDLYKGAQ
jgi:hypothetical protein